MRIYRVKDTTLYTSIYRFIYSLEGFYKMILKSKRYMIMYRIL